MITMLQHLTLLELLAGVAIAGVGSILLAALFEAAADAEEDGR